MRYAMALILMLAAVTAWAGTVTIDFASNTGLLTYKVTGSGTLSSVSGRGYFSGSNATFLAQGGSPIYSGGTTSATITLQPAVDAVNGVGIVMLGGGEQLTAVVYGDGSVTMTDWIGNYATGHFTYPNASNSVTLTYSASLERATLALNGASVGFLELALNGATSVQTGVMALGVGGLSRFVASGPGLPDYPPPSVDTDGDGVNDDVEGVAGTDAHDPGNLPVYNTSGATIHALNGAVVVIAAGSLPASQINVAVSTPVSIPDGTLPVGKALTQVGLELKPDGTHFSTPVNVTVPYTWYQIAGVDEASLNPVYYTGHGYSTSGLVPVGLDMANHKATFTTTHFTTFALAGDSLDTDGDGIDDWWEMAWFGDLTMADATSNYDGDAYTDLQEFQGWDIGMNPLVAGEQLPIGGAAALTILGSGLALAAVRRLRRRG